MVRRASIATVLVVLTSTFIGLTGIGLGGSPAPASAAVFDAAAYPLKFNSANRVAISPSGATGTTAGDVLRYNGVATIDGTVIDAVVRVVAINAATITKLDDGGAVTSSPPGSAQTVGDLLLTDVGTTAAGSVTLEVSFFEGGTYTGSGSGVPVTLANVKLNTYDIDSGGVNRQYVDFRGFQSYLTYTGAAPNGVTISNQSDGYVRFEAATSAAATATTGSYSWSRVQVNFDRTSTMQVRMGVLASGGGYFALDFSAGGIWTTDGTTPVVPTSGSNPNNRPPTTADVSLLRATVNNSTVLTAADFPYSDLDSNAMASVRVVTVPSATDAALEYFNGTSWQTVTDGFVISTSDLDLGKLRITPITPSGSFTFQVNDGLAYSGTSTLSYTSPPNAQTITFANPGTRAPGATIVSGATASSGLTPTLTSMTPSVCTVSGLSILTSSLPSGVSTAICVITATQQGDATYGRADAVTQQFSVSSLLAQTITFADPGDRSFSTTAIVSGATATPSGLTVTLSSLTPSVCTVSGGSITPVTPGVCSVRATQAGNATYAPAPPVTQTFTLTPAVQTITFGQPAAQVINGGPLAVAPTASSGLTPSLASDTPTVCSVSGTSIAFLTTGVCTVTATQTGNANYGAASPVTRSFDIDLVPQSITFTQPSDQQLANGTLVVAPTASSGLTPSLTSDAPAICSVSGMSITFLASGLCTVTASQPGNSTYAAATPVTRSFGIGFTAQTITFAQPADQAMNGGPLVVAPTASSGLTPVLTSSTPTICSVSGMSISFVGAGVCTIDANQPGDAAYAPADPVSHSFDISAVAQTVAFSAPADQLISDGSLVVAPTASSGLTPVLTSGTPTVCSVSGFTISFIATGECTVTASQAGNSTYSAATPVSHSFDIAQLGQTITYPQPTDVSLGDPAATLVATTDAAGLTTTLTSSTPAVCTVSGHTVSFVSPGLCTVTAAQAGDATHTAATPVARSFRVIEITTKTMSPMDRGQTVSRQLTVAGAAGGGTWWATTPLPAGLVLDATTGKVSGTPTETFTGDRTFVYTENGVDHEATILLDIRAADLQLLASTGVDVNLPVTAALLLVLLGGIALAFAARTRRRRS